MIFVVARYATGRVSKRIGTVSSATAYSSRISSARVCGTCCLVLGASGSWPERAAERNAVNATTVTQAGNDVIVDLLGGFPFRMALGFDGAPGGGIPAENHVLALRGAGVLRGRFACVLPALLADRGPDAGLGLLLRGRGGRGLSPRPDVHELGLGLRLGLSLRLGLGLRVAAEPLGRLEL